MLKKMTTLKNFVSVSADELVSVNGGCGTKEGLSPACKVQSPKQKNNGGGSGGGSIIPTPSNEPSTGTPGYDDYINAEMEARKPENYW